LQEFKIFEERKHVTKGEMATMTMKEIIVHPLPELHTTIHEVNVPTPGPDEIIVRVVVAGSNVKDWDHITNLNIEINSGDDGAGFVHALGKLLLHLFPLSFLKFMH
jgi:Zn-dependent alcohol dehydrogenase